MECSLCAFLSLHEHALLDLFILMTFLLRFNLDTGTHPVLSVRLAFKMNACILR